MDRNEFIKMLNSRQISASVIAEYCLEHGKDAALTQRFIEALMSTGMINMCVNDVVEYYCKKLEVNKVIDLKTGQVLLNY